MARFRKSCAAANIQMKTSLEPFDETDVEASESGDQSLDAMPGVRNEFGTSSEASFAWTSNVVFTEPIGANP